MLAKLALAVLLLGALASAQTSPTGVPLSTSGRHPFADIFNGGFAYVNTSTYNGSVWLNTGAGKVGNIIYTPAYPGALYGTMGVDYGHVLPSTDTCMFDIEDFSGYTGGYRAFPLNGTVQHYPEVTSNPIDGHTQANLVAQRFVYRMDDDNTIALGQNPTASLLFWTKNYRFPGPAGQQCNAAVIAAMLPQEELIAHPEKKKRQSLSPFPPHPIASIRTFEIYVFNQGDIPLQSVNVFFNLATGVTIDSVVGFQGNSFFNLVTFPQNTDGSYTFTYGPYDVQGIVEPLSLPIFSVTVQSSTSLVTAGAISASIDPASVTCSYYEYAYEVKK